MKKQTLNDLISKRNEDIEEKKEETREVKRKKGRVAALFSLCEDIIGKKAYANDPIIVTDPDTGLDVMDPQEIKRVSLKNCVSILTNKELEEEH